MQAIVWLRGGEVGRSVGKFGQVGEEVCEVVEGCFGVVSVAGAFGEEVEELV